MNKRLFACISLLALVLSTGCATSPETDSRFVRLEDQYAMVSNTTQASQYAPVQLKEAREALDKLDRLLENDADEQRVSHQVYLVERKLDIAAQTTRMKRADEVIEQADARRNELVIAARTRRAESAEARAAEQERQAQQAKREAIEAKREAQQAQKEALAAKAVASAMTEKAKALEDELQNISTQKTERGLVLTLGNILFEVDEATIKTGSERTLQRVASFLKEYPERDVLIEGFTDNTGSNEYNMDLSERRASAVKQSLVSDGVDAQRISTTGYGENHPVATNESSAGRLQNRRVEIVIANEGEQVQTRQ